MSGEGSERQRERAVTRDTLVREAAMRQPLEPCRVDGGADLLAVAECISSHPGVHVAAVVDTDARLVGIISLRLLLRDLFLRVAPEEFLAELSEMEDVAEFGRITRAHTARELMEAPAYVRMEDTVGEAFGLMYERRLEGLPIVDSEMAVIGYLDRLQLLRLWLDPTS